MAKHFSLPHIGCYHNERFDTARTKSSGGVTLGLQTLVSHSYISNSTQYQYFQYFYNNIIFYNIDKDPGAGG